MAKEVESIVKEAKAPEHRLVKSAELQAAARIDNKTETNLNATKLPGVKMYWIKGEGLLCESAKEKVFVPSTNVKFAIFAKV